MVFCDLNFCFLISVLQLTLEASGKVPDIKELNVAAGATTRKDGNGCQGVAVRMAS